MVEPLGQVDERAADQQADRLEPERDGPGRAADPAEQLVGRKAVRSVMYVTSTIDWADAGDERGREQDRDTVDGRGR